MLKKIIKVTRLRTRLLVLAILFSQPLFTSSASSQHVLAYDASSMTTKVEVILGLYDKNTQSYKNVFINSFNDLNGWSSFKENLDFLSPVTDQTILPDISQQSYIIVNEYDNRMSPTRETVFSPGVIKIKFYDVYFTERFNKSRDFFIDLLEMQMRDASFKNETMPNVPVTKDGIIIRFTISDILDNPTWEIKRGTDMKKIMDFADQELLDWVELPVSNPHSIGRIEDYTSLGKDSFVIYLNTKLSEATDVEESGGTVDATKLPFRIYADDEGAMALKKYSYGRQLIDDHNYYEYFLQYFTELAKVEQANSGQ